MLKYVAMNERSRAGLFATLVLSAAVAVSCRGADVTPVKTPNISPSQPVSAEPSSILTLLPTLEPTPILSPTPEPTKEQATVYWIFAHPDDETLAAVGAIYDSQKAGNKNVVIIVTDGESTAVGPRLGLSLKQVAVAREKEATAALGVIGIKPIFLREPDAGVYVQVGFVENEIKKLAEETPGTVLFRGHSTNDPYRGLPHGHPDHYAVAMALEAEYKNGEIKNLEEYTVGQFAGTKPHGTCVFLSKQDMIIKQEMRKQYALIDPKIGRYGIAVRSVPAMWEKTTSEPECYTTPTANLTPQPTIPPQSRDTAIMI